MSFADINSMSDIIVTAPEEIQDEAIYGQAKVCALHSCNKITQTYVEHQKSIIRQA